MALPPLSLTLWCLPPRETPVHVIEAEPIRVADPAFVRACAVVRTCVRVDPPRRPRFVLRVGRAARRCAPPGPAGDRRWGRCARGELRGEGIWRAHRDGRAPRAPPVPAGRRRRAPLSGVRRREQSCVPRVRRSSPLWSKGSRSTRRSSTFGGWSGSRARRPRSRCGCVAPSSSRSACRSRSASPARSFSRRWRARWRSPTDCSSCPPDGELGFLHPLPVERLWGVGQVTADKLRRRGITTVGQVAALPEAALVWMLGRASGRHLHALAHNRDPRPVVARRRRGSVGSQCALGRSKRSPGEVEAILMALVDGVARRLRAGRRVCRTVVLRMRFDDYSRATRSQTLARPTAHTGTILAAAQELLATARPLIAEKGLTLVGVSVANLLDEVPMQLVLPFDEPTWRSTRPSTGCGSDSGRRPSRARCCSG